MRLRRRDVAGALVALGIAALCVRLGFWQLDRLAQRRARNAQAAARLALSPLELGRGAGGGGGGGGGDAAPGDSGAGRRIVARGVYDFAHERVRPGRSFEGTPGVSLVTPLRLPDGTAVLVDRGWVPSPDAFQVDQAAYREPDTARVEGLGVTPATALDSFPYPILPVIVRQEVPPPLAVHGLPRRWPRPALSGGPHLSYAIQWFSFAVIIVVGTVALLRRAADPGAAPRG